MTLSTVSIWLAIAFAFFLSLPALWMAIRALLPKRHRKQVLVARAGMIKTLLVALIPTAFFAVVAAALQSKAGGGASAAVAVLALFWGWSGMAGHATLIGRRLWRQAGPWRQTRNGGLVLVCCAALPVVGWAVILPMLAVLGMGVNVRSWFTKLPAKVPPVG
jgi:hypothetical protein